MLIETVDTLASQAEALQAEEVDRPRVFRERVMEPLRFLWEPMMAFLPASLEEDESEDPALRAARRFGFYPPDGSAEDGLAAIAMLGNASSQEACALALTDAVSSLRPEEHGVHIPSVFFTLILADPDMPNFMERNYGYTGFGGQPGRVIVLVWPTEFNVPRLPAVVAHEFHHNVRLSFEPWTPQTTVGQYVVLEGMAEAFASETCGDDKVGPWATALSDAQLDEVRPRFRDAIDVAGFDQISGYVFGDWAAAEFGYEPKGLPDFAGYSFGYHLVRAYLRRTGRTAAEATYVPWREVVQESGYL